MITVTGAHNSAICYTNELEPTARAQIRQLCDQPHFAGSRIRIMPDVHAGMGCTIGTTMTITDKVVPGMVGVDIGCGMETVRVAETALDFPRLDALIRREIPSGRNIRGKPHPLNREIDLDSLRCACKVKLDRARLSIGTLGGGNHFIEVDQDAEGRLYIVVHSGSRHLGYETALYYQEEGYRALCGNAQHQIEAMIQQLKKEGRSRDIDRTVKRLKRKRHRDAPLPKDMAYVEGGLFDDYIHDMCLVQRFAVLNRKAMMDVIITGMGLTVLEDFTTIHNYIDMDSMILRKGAVSAKKGEKLLIPINMRDGSLICQGKGNPDWNQSAPHGAGRTMSRRSAFSTLDMAEYRAQMAGIFTTSVGPDTLDESPMAYKPMDDIMAQIGPTAEILSHIKPVYNFKAAE
jgi:tRNA-splicing ligase RtcB